MGGWVGGCARDGSCVCGVDTEFDLRKIWIWMWKCVPLCGMVVG